MGEKGATLVDYCPKKYSRSIIHRLVHLTPTPFPYTRFSDDVNLRSTLMPLAIFMINALYLLHSLYSTYQESRSPREFPRLEKDSGARGACPSRTKIGSPRWIRTSESLFVAELIICPSAVASSRLSDRVKRVRFGFVERVMEVTAPRVLVLVGGPHLGPHKAPEDLAYGVHRDNVEATIRLALHTNYVRNTCGHVENGNPPPLTTG